LLFAVTALPATQPSHASAASNATAAVVQETDAIAASSTIADEALKDLGTWQGQCFTWVKKVVDQATSYSMGFGYRDGYLGAGAVEIPLEQAVRGDIIQLANDALGASSHLGLHSAIVLENLGAGRFNVIDSNQNWDEIVRLRPGYDPLASAARYAGVSVHVYRFPGASAVDAPPLPATLLAPGDPAIVNADGDCLRLRATPGLGGTRIDCLQDGTAVSVTGAAVVQDGLSWVPVDTYLGSGWVAAAYLTTIAPAPQAPQVTTPADTSGEDGTTPIANAIEGGGYTLPVPPLGGLTQGLAGTDDPAALIEAQAFPVQTLSMFDITLQTYLTYIPGAPAHVNTLDSTRLDAAAIVALKRSESGAASAVTPSTPAVTGAVAFPSPPVNGLTQGLAGTSDVAALIAAQPFPVQTLSAWHIQAQRFLTYIPGAPAYVSTLSNETLTPDMVVMIRRGSSAVTSVGTTPVADPPPEAAAPEPAPVDQRTASITYYYCTQGSIPAGIGDGGGWCGGMANGETVYEGAASCASQYLGQQFKILGDPNERIYTCADTGGGVTGEHRDIFFNNSDDGYQWWLQVGSTATIEIVS
jgi:hypothetical protein